jgi:superfamily II DNA helicase RecQ
MGDGKTLSFWIPLLMAIEDGEEKLMFVISLLNILEKQNVQVLLGLNISAIALSSENTDTENF